MLSSPFLSSIHILSFGRIWGLPYFSQIGLKFKLGKHVYFFVSPFLTWLISALRCSIAIVVTEKFLGVASVGYLLTSITALIALYGILSPL